MRHIRMLKSAGQGARFAPSYPPAARRPIAWCGQQERYHFQAATLCVEYRPAPYARLRAAWGVV